eukprot:5206723-Pleurochrysis_carterae.AAC.4
MCVPSLVPGTFCERSAGGCLRPVAPCSGRRRPFAPATFAYPTESFAVPPNPCFAATRAQELESFGGTRDWRMEAAGQSTGRCASRLDFILSVVRYPDDLGLSRCRLGGERARCSFSYTEAPASSLALALAPALPSGHCGVSSYSVATRASRLHVASRAARAFSSGRRRALRRAGADQPACHQRCRACIVLVCAAAAPLGSSATSSGHSLWQSHHARTHAHARTCTHAHLNTDSTDTRTRPRACPHTRVRAHVHFPARTHTRMCMHSRAHPRV